MLSTLLPTPKNLCVWGRQFEVVVRLTTRRLAGGAAARSGRPGRLSGVGQARSSCSPGAPSSLAMLLNSDSASGNHGHACLQQSGSPPATPLITVHTFADALYLQITCGRCAQVARVCVAGARALIQALLHATGCPAGGRDEVCMAVKTGLTWLMAMALWRGVSRERTAMRK